jgi:hypothetical protein
VTPSAAAAQPTPAAADRPSSAAAGRPIGSWLFLGFALASFGGPLALAALIVPSVVEDATSSAGLAVVAATVVFGVPLYIWLDYARHVSGSGGLTGFVEAAAGRRVALAQGAVWSLSYLLYIVYTPLQIVYDLLPNVLPGERRYQSLLEVLIPVGIALLMLAGRRAALLATALIAVVQLAFAGILDVVTLAHVPLPTASFGTAGAGAGALAKAGAQSSLLYICGSLPLFLGGELAHPARTIRRWLPVAYALTALVVVLAVAPLAESSGFAQTEIPGMAVTQAFAGHGLAVALGIAIALSVGGVIIAEYAALARLVHAFTAWSPRRICAGIGAVLVVSAPLSLIDPDSVYDALLKPSLVALWVSQLVVFAVYPRFARRHGRRVLPAWALSAVASAFAVYGIVVTFQHASS